MDESQGESETPYYQDEWVTIYRGDCREVIPQISNVGLVITSPPYNLGLKVVGPSRKWGSHRRHGISVKYNTSRDDLLPHEYKKMCLEVLDKCLLISPAVACNVQWATGNKLALCEMLGERGSLLKDVAIWDKGHGQPAVNKGTMNPSFEMIFVFGGVPRNFV